MTGYKSKLLADVSFQNVVLRIANLSLSRWFWTIFKKILKKFFGRFTQNCGRCLKQKASMLWMKFKKINPWFESHLIWSIFYSLRVICLLWSTIIINLLERKCINFVKSNILAEWQAVKFSDIPFLLHDVSSHLVYYSS